MKLMIVLLVLVIAGLQYRAWFSEDGYFAVQALNERLERQQRRAELQRQRNRLLAAEVLALKEGHAAVEARARADLGMIREGERFYILTEEPAAGNPGELPGMPNLERTHEPGQARH